MSAVATIGYCAFLVGPPLIGFVGQQIGLLNGLLIVLGLIVIAAIVAPAARELNPRATSARSALRAERERARSERALEQCPAWAEPQPPAF